MVDSALIVGDKALPNALLQRISSYEHQLKNADVITEIGTRDGDEQNILGTVDRAILENDTLYVLDGKSHQVKLYTLSGKYIGSFGRYGRGPGEFTKPNDFTLDSQGRIWIVSADRSVTIFSGSAGQYEHVNTFKVDIDPQAICTIGDRAYIYGMSLPQEAQGIATSEFSSIHTYNENGVLEGSFGSLYRSNNYAVADVMSTASDIECSDDGSIIVQYRYLPTVVSVNSRSGAINWGTLFPNHHSVKAQGISRGGRIGVRLKKPDRGAVFGDQLTRFQSLIISQYTVLSSGRNELRSYIIDTRSGKAARLDWGTADKLFSINHDIAVFGSNTPFPSLRIVTLR